MRKKQTGRQKCFRQRDRSLKKLGFNSYKEYLKSDLWSTIRLCVLEKRKFICHFCNEKATEVHHIRYSQNVLGMLNKHFYGGLVATCRSCHQNISDYAKTNKIHEKEAFDLFNV